jgi:hypothetical protein
MKSGHFHERGVHGMVVLPQRWVRCGLTGMLVEIGMTEREVQDHAAGAKALPPGICDPVDGLRMVNSLGFQIFRGRWLAN